METSPSIWSRLGERVLGWIALGILVALGVAIWQTPAGTKAAIWSGVWRTVLWVVVVAALPWSSWFVMSRVVGSGSNWAGAGLLAALVGADVVAALVLMTAWPSGGWMWLLSLGLLSLAGVYNYLVTEYLAEQTG